MNRTADITERVTCPFDPVHVIERSRLQKHIIKCKRNLPANHDFVQCQFWGLHYVKKNQLQAHYETCEHSLAKQATKRTAAAETCRFKEPKLIQDPCPTSIDYDDSWDIPSNQPCFRPELLRENASTMVIPTGLPKSQRREHREQERKRLRENEGKSKVSQEFEKSWSTGTDYSDQFDVTPRLPKTPAFRAESVYGSSVGSSFNQSPSTRSSNSQWLDNSYSEPRAQTTVQLTNPASMTSATSHNVVRTSGRGRGRGQQLLAWGSDSRPSHHPHPYNGIPYKYSSNDFPEL